MSSSVLFWRRIDVEGLERLELTVASEGVSATAAVICLEAGGFRIEHRWRLGPDWRAQSVTVERWNARGHGVLHLERAGTGWRVGSGNASPPIAHPSEISSYISQRFG